MKKLIVLVAVLAIAASACGGGDDVVASVNGSDITRTSVESMVRDAGEGFTDSEFAQYLSVLIQWEIVGQGAEQLGVEVGDDDIDARVDQLVVDSGAPSIEGYIEAVNASESGVRGFARQLLIQDRLLDELAGSIDPVTDDEVGAAIAESPMEWTQVCVSHILVATAEEAATVTARLDSGEDFAAVAAEVSTDPGSATNGGDLGCSSPSQYVEPFAEETMSADIDVVTEPVESQFGWHLILVRSRVEASSDQVRAFLEQQRQSDAIDAWFLDQVSAADVTVAEDVGRWVTDPSPQVLVVN